MLVLEGVRAGYGTIEVLKGIDLRVDEGEIVTLIGANGAGKTSTLMCASGVLRRRAGTMWRSIPTRTFSHTVMSGKSRMFWKVRAIPTPAIALGDFPTSSVCSRRIDPSSAR